MKLLPDLSPWVREVEHDEERSGQSRGEPVLGWATRVLIAALGQLPQADADALRAGITTLERREEMGRRIVALCELGVEAKVITELARPYAQAQNPAAVAAGRVRQLWAAYGRPRTSVARS